MSLIETHRPILQEAVAALRDRRYYSPFPENPKAYPAEAGVQGEASFHASLNKDFDRLLQDQPLRFEGEEVSPYLQSGLGIRYPVFADKTLVAKAVQARSSWLQAGPELRCALLVESLMRLRDHFVEIAHATMHTTGQSYMMSFQASGPHAADRALECVAMAWQEQTRYAEQANWVKSMGKISVELHKTWKPVGKGVGLVVGCSTFPTWNSLPGIYASLAVGNPVLVKPHPKAVYPIAIVTAVIQTVLQENGFSPNLCQLACDSTAHPLTKELATHPEVRTIDYTGNSEFGQWLEAQSLFGKTVFTEKAGVNAVLVHSAPDLKAVWDNLAFSVSLYAGQMCTAPQNIFLPTQGITDASGQHHSYQDLVDGLRQALRKIKDHPQMGPGVLATVQNSRTMERIRSMQEQAGDAVLLASEPIAHEAFPHALSCSPLLVEANVDRKDWFGAEQFGPIAFVIPYTDVDQAMNLMLEQIKQHGALSCGLYCTDAGLADRLADCLADAFVPVS
ncbi:MAG: aldehyde dehydrogenase family protein, partial [Bacteroidetes bacterium]|nr:aldehyde dehydrogenase family protein [Bacteroidota bacterium]